MFEEPHIIINGKELSVGQSMTMRVALVMFLDDMLKADACGDDDHGKRLAELYSLRGTEVMRMMIDG